MANHTELKNIITTSGLKEGDTMEDILASIRKILSEDDRPSIDFDSPVDNDPPLKYNDLGDAMAAEWEAASGVHSQKEDGECKAHREGLEKLDALAQEWNGYVPDIFWVDPEEPSVALADDCAVDIGSTRVMSQNEIDKLTGFGPVLGLDNIPDTPNKSDDIIGDIQAIIVDGYRHSLDARDMLNKIIDLVQYHK